MINEKADVNKLFFRSKSFAGYPHNDNSGVRTKSAEVELAFEAA